jgi:hypothetical protein
MAPAHGFDPIPPGGSDTNANGWILGESRCNGWVKKMDGNGWWFYLEKNNLNKHDEDCLLLLLFGKYGHTRYVI